MKLLKKIVYLNLFLARVFCTLEEVQAKFTSLPFSFGLVLSAFKFEDSQEGILSSESYALIPPKGIPEQSEAQALQAISVAEVLRDPGVKQNRVGPSIIPLACISESVLELDLREGSLTSREHYIASVDDTHQFRFEEFSQGERYKLGAWLVSARGQLEYQNVDLFYQCHSGESYKLYDAPVHSRCAPVLLDVVELVSCQ